MLHYIQSNLFDGLTFILSLIGAIYALVNESIKFKNRKFKVDVRITERSDLNDKPHKKYGMLIRLQIHNLSWNNLAISSVDLFETNKELHLSADNYSHYVRTMKYEEYSHPVFTSDFPIDIPGKSSTSVLLIFFANKQIDDLDKPKLKLLTTQGAKTTDISYIEPSKNVEWFS